MGPEVEKDTQLRKAVTDGLWRVLTGDKSMGVGVKKSSTTPDLEDPREDVNQLDDEQLLDDQRNRILESRFDVADAFNMQETMEDVDEQQHKSEQVSQLASDTSSNVESIMSMAQTTEGEQLERVPTIKKVFTNKSTGQIDLPPDGGYGWICCFCVFLVMFSTWGCNSGFGVFLGFYLNNDTYPHATKYDYALIAGFTVALGQGMSPFVMVIMRIIGMKPTMLFGDALLLAGFILASFTKKIWQLYLTQGVLIGFGISFIFVPSTVVLPGWFLKRRAVALGISLLGTGAGGVTYGLAANKMIQNTGNTRWALRILGISCSTTVVVATMLIRERKPIKPIGLKNFKAIRKEFHTMFSVKILKRPIVLLIAVWFAFALFGYNLMIFTLSPYSIAKGLSAHDASTLTAVLNGSQAIGRPLMGLAGDRFGRTNVTISLTTLLAIYLFAFWIPSHTFVQLLFFSIMTGSCVGVANVMSTVLIADMAGPVDFLPAWACVNYLGAPLLLLPEVIAQALTQPEHKSNPYLHTQIFAGCCFSFALLLACCVRSSAVWLKYNQKLIEVETKLKEYANDRHSSDEKSNTSINLSYSDEEKRLIELRDRYKELLKRTPRAYVKRIVHKMIV